MSRPIKTPNSAVIFFTRSPEKDARKKFPGFNYLNSKKLFEELIQRSIEVINNVKLKIKFDLIIASEETPLTDLNHINILQHGKTFHKKFTNVIEDVFKLGYEKVIILGNDTPELSEELVEGTLNKLNNQEIVIGPSRDGGFYLLGMSNYNHDIFNNIKWHSNKVLKGLTQNIKSLGYDYKLLKLLSDIDSELDLNYFRKVEYSLPRLLRLIIFSFFVKPWFDQYRKIVILFTAFNPTLHQLPPPLFS